VAYDDRYAYAAWAVFTFPGLELLAVSGARHPVTAEYRTGFLAQRELPALRAAFAQLTIRPDVIICDGAGIAHPRRRGLARELGQALGIPTIGCAKTRLVGRRLEPGKEPGSHRAIRVGRETLGTILRTKAGVKPVYVSPGQLITVAAAWRVVLACCRGYRLPEPLRRAHFEAGRLRAAASAAETATARRPAARRHPSASSEER